MISLMLLAAISAPVDHPKTFLLSVVDIPVKDPDSIESFTLTTWGVRFTTICRIPFGWTIKAGGSAGADGVLEGRGGQGVTWYRQRSPRPLHNFVLVTLYDGIQRKDIITDHGNGVVPATFKGYATLSVDDGDRQIKLDYRNIRLVRARHCPAT